jgi:phospholipid transport system transporter-binding protein
MTSVRIENNLVNIQGPVTYDQIPEILNSTKAIAWNKPLRIDLKGVTDLDTSLLSLIFEWKRQAGANSQNIEIINNPPNLKILSKLYGVEAYL